MKIIRSSLFLSLVILGAENYACHPTPQPMQEPTSVPMEPLALSASTPERAASMRLVEQGQDEISKGRFERAAYRLSQAMEVDSTNPFAYFYLGVVRMRTSRYQQAADLFGRAADLFSMFKSWKAEALAYRGENVEKLGRSEEARKIFERASSIDAGNGRAKEGLSRLETPK